MLYHTFHVLLHMYLDSKTNRTVENYLSPSTHMYMYEHIFQSYDGNGVIGNPDSDQTRIGRSGHTQWVPDGTYR